MPNHIAHPSSKNMLPHPYSPEFPAALKARRELMGMSRAALAKAAGIHVVMPRRYEEPDCGEFARPRPETTWLALNRALGYQIPTDLEKDFSDLLKFQEHGMFGSGPLSDPDEAQWAPNTSQAKDEPLAVPRTAEGSGRDKAEPVRPLSIAEAKQGLSMMFGVDPSRIEILIKG
jgi:transcriptional regulator with XRE-family HTH domain